MQLMVII